jgi:predicted nuclease of restriction endonuclease-like (RecB) superfamily
MANDVSENIEADSGYRDWLFQLKDKLRRVQIKAAVAVNREMLQFYWELGADIVHKQKSASWGDGFLPQLSRDLLEEFPEIKGFSISNLKYMRQWFLFYAGGSSIGQQAVGQIPQPPVSYITQIPWGHGHYRQMQES